MTRSPSAIPKLFGLGAALAGVVLLAAPAEAKRPSLSGLFARIAALEGTVAELKDANTQLQTELAEERADRQAADDALQALFDALPGGSLPAIRAAVDELQADVADLRADSVPGLADHVSVIERMRDLDGNGTDDMVPTVLFEGANVQIVDGTGRTASSAGRPSGLGNLIVGYDEAVPSGEALCSDGRNLFQITCDLSGEIWAPNQKNGAHNLVVGPFHFYSQAGGVVFGEENVINGPGAVVSGGSENTASANISSVSGGFRNTAGGTVSSVSGGFNNTARGRVSSVSGGEDNIAAGESSSVSGGEDNVAAADRSSVSGGRQNTASGESSSVSGGEDNVAAAGRSSVSGGAFNTASGPQSSVSGGNGRSALGTNDWVAGSLFEPF